MFPAQNNSRFLHFKTTSFYFTEKKCIQHFSIKLWKEKSLGRPRRTKANWGRGGGLSLKQREDPYSFQMLRMPHFLVSRQTGGVMMSVYAPATLYPHKDIHVLISVKGWVKPRGHIAARIEKKAITSSRLEPAIFNQLRYRVPPSTYMAKKKLKQSTSWL
jgi:hypothetical protein